MVGGRHLRQGAIRRTSCRSHVSLVPHMSMFILRTTLWLAIAACVAGSGRAQSPPAEGPLLLRPGDAIRLAVKDEPTLSGQYVVAEDGNVLLPLIGAVAVAARPFPQVQQQIQAAYGLHLIEPILQVTPLVRIAVLGEVRQPGLYPVDPSYTLADAIAAAGGLSPQANQNKISLVRGGEVVVARLNVHSQSLGVTLRSGDQILVARRGWLVDNLPILIGAATSVAAAALTAVIIR